ncbi:penicillin-binding protein 1C [uncultured Campylobacter sp.]|uniref:penicillin-binding protein 1C n=1 Tax=uncultured Campylobacter sp. TaxID=218934 RepID=UPI0026098B53|nr:penicillin-binding protein 1C [uncultured Campylobacter sp.]
MKDKLIKALLCVFALGLFYALFVFFAFDKNEFLSSFEQRYSRVLYDKNKNILSAFINKDEQWHLRSDDISERLKIAVINYEDKNFYSHFGVDFLAFLRALKDNLTREKRSGASTISMQLIKLNEKNERTYFNKINEIIKAFALESSLSKDEILNLYLNNAPYGGNLVGFASAIRFYFDKNPKDLSWSEAAVLAVLPNNPSLINLEKNKDKLLKKRNALLEKLFQKGHISDDIYKLSLLEPLPKFYPRRNLAPHLAQHLLNDSKKELVSSIDKNLQIKFEKKAKQYSSYLQKLGIQNLAILLLDTKRYKALVYIGSQDFYDENLGQINGVLAKRSAGSTLKPFLYALAIDEGLIAPNSLLLDVPTFFSNFFPQNANKKYYGLISAKESLQRSLNVPFVSLLRDYGYEKFFYKMKDFLAYEDEDYERYGLSFILGTKEFSLEELSKLYLALGNYGLLGEISYIEDEPMPERRQIFSKASAYLSLDALKSLQRVGLENYNKIDKIVSWKTGTSYGRKDALAIGTTPKYTLGVWVGNFTGEANANLYGVSIAGDLFFELLSLLDDVNLDFKASDDLINIKLDSLTRYRFDDSYNGFNIDYTYDLYPASAKVLRTSPFLKKIYEYEGKIVDSLDTNFKDAKAKFILDLPANAQTFFQKEKIFMPQSKKLKILYPQNALNLILSRNLDGKKSFVIRLASSNDENLFYYLNEKLIYSGKSKELELDLNAGAYTLFVINESGDSDEVSFSIKR